MKHSTLSYWCESSPATTFPAIDEPRKADVVIIGAGITGLMTAYLLRKQGASVIVLDRDSVGGGESSRTTAHLTCVTDEPLTALAQRHGKDHAVATWDAGAAAIEKIHEVMHAEGINCDFSWVPGYYHASLEAPAKGARAQFEREVEFARSCGFSAELCETIPFVETLGVKFDRQAKFHPTRFLNALATILQREAHTVFERSEVSQFSDDGRSLTVNGHTVQADTVIVATNVPLQGRTPTVKAALFQTKIFPYTSYVVRATLPGEVAPALYWDTTDPYYYIRTDIDGDGPFMIMGGADCKTGQESKTENRFDRIERVLQKFAPDSEVTHRWAGQVVETSDGIPYIGEVGHKQFIATGFAGNGFTFGTIAAMIMSDALGGRKNPWSDLFHPDRVRLKTAAWDYVKENSDYPYYMAKGYLVGSSSHRPQTLKPGEGAICSIDGKRVAACRDLNGDLHTVSAECTHMGCLVGWNNSLQSWDCPCHGSRFTPTGAVIGGPAETPLADIKLKEE